MDPTLFAWVVGLYEGEGTCYLGKNNKKRNYLTPYVSIQMTDREPLDRALEITGFGTVVGPRIPAISNKYSTKPFYLWRFTAQQDVVDFFEAAWPMLSERRRIQAEPVLDQCRSRLLARAAGERHAKPLGWNTAIRK